MAINRNMPIVIVDDYATMLRIVKNILEQIGFTNIYEAKSGEEALQKIVQHNAKLVISDWNMAPMSGIELLRAVRANDNYKSTPFIMVTAESKMENVIEAKEAGVSNYIIKPFNAVTLKQKIASVMGDNF